MAASGARPPQNWDRRNGRWSRVPHGWGSIPDLALGLLWA